MQNYEKNPIEIPVSLFFFHSIGPNLAKILPQRPHPLYFNFGWFPMKYVRGYIAIYIYIYEQETSVSMCYTITVKQKTQHLFDKFFIIYTINVNINVLQSSSSEKDC